MIQDYSQPPLQNPNQLQYNTMNPNAMSGMNTLQALNGTQVDGTAMRNLNTVPVENPSAVPIQPPASIATKTVPTYNFQTYS